MALKMQSLDWLHRHHVELVRSADSDPKPTPTEQNVEVAQQAL